LNKNPNSSLRQYFRILSYLKPYARQIIVIMIFNFLFVIFNALSIWMVAPFVSTLFESQDTQVEQKIESEPEEEVSFFDLNEWLKSKIDHLFKRTDKIETLKLLCFLIFFTFLLKNMFAFLEAWFVTFVEQKAVKDMRDETYGHILRQQLSFFSRYDTGNLMSRITNDITTLSVTLNQNFTKVIREPLVVIIFLIILVSISWQLTLIALLVFPITGFMITRIGRIIKRRSRKVQEKIADISTVLQETFTGIKVVKAFSMEKYEDDKFKEKTDTHFRASVRQLRMNRLGSPLSETLGIGIMVLVLWFGGSLVLVGQLISAEDFIRFLAVLFSIMSPIKALGQLNNDVQVSLAAGNRIFSILDTKSDITDKPDAINKDTFDKKINYTDVTFQYSKNDDIVLQDINLAIEKNKKVAFVGGSGAGKTTLINLLPRFYDVQKGSIQIDDNDIRDIKMSNLRKLMGIVTQEVILFNDTIANNIAYGLKEYSRADIERAARLANAYDFVTEFPDGFDTMIGERGMRLSGGQRQRISIARAILKNPPILIFDEATSSLDSESERLIQEAIDNLMKDRTVLIVAHRLSSIIKSDYIIVMEKGQIIDVGSHDELLERSERYKFLYQLQFAETKHEKSESGNSNSQGLSEST
jgi:ATP-binding cassette, subfamily B, bacterial MsbA